jgi:phosphoribosyl-ATP pyrophosphohydrolase
VDLQFTQTVSVSARRKLIERLTQTMVNKFGSEASEVIRAVIDNRLSVEMA